MAQEGLGSDGLMSRQPGAWGREPQGGFFAVLCPPIVFIGLTTQLPLQAPPESIDYWKGDSSAPGLSHQGRYSVDWKRKTKRPKKNGEKEALWGGKELERTSGFLWITIRAFTGAFRRRGSGTVGDTSFRNRKTCLVSFLLFTVRGDTDLNGIAGTASKVRFS